MPEYTEKQKEQRKQAVLRYQKTVDRVNCMFPAGTKERMLQYADSCNAYIREVVLSDLEKRDRKKARKTK